MNQGLCYCYATANAGPAVRYPDESAELTRRFGRWHDPIPRLLAGTTANTVLHNDVEHLVEPLPSFSRGRVALLGDAAHAMTPDLGQGGCQALEDAVVLAATMRDVGSSGVSAALPHYTAERRPRTTSVARRSRRSGLVYRAPPIVQNLAARLTNLAPPSLIARGIAPVADWRPPDDHRRQ